VQHKLETGTLGRKWGKNSSIAGHNNVRSSETVTGQPYHRRNILHALFFGAIGYFYAHQWACDGLREVANGDWHK
jgi:hypothetical protein